MLRRIFSPCTLLVARTGNRKLVRHCLNDRELSNLSDSFEKVLGASSSVANRELSFYEGGAMGHLAEASAVCSQGGSVVHATVCSARNSNPQDDFLPLTVDYRSRSYAAGRIPKSSNRRERHGSDEEILVSRVIDRAIRPLFPKGYVNEVQVTVTAHAAGNNWNETIVPMLFVKDGIYTDSPVIIQGIFGFSILYFQNRLLHSMCSKSEGMATKYR